MVCFSGTPCQIEGLRHFLGKDYQNLILVDVVCRAVPSPGVWEKYIQYEVEQKGKLSSIRFRDKSLGYQYSTMELRAENGKKYRGGIESQPWLRMFFSGMIIRPSCTDCRFRSRYRNSDFTIWDCFPSYKYDKSFDERKGTTRVLIHSEKGKKLFANIKNCFKYCEVSSDDKPIIIHTIEYFENHPMIDAIALVCVADWIDYCKSLLYKFRIDKVKAIVPGGETGQLSIYNGLKAAKEIAGDEESIVLIHDGVRPLINDKVITDNINSVKEHGSAITTAVVKETILVVDPETSTIDYVPSRNNSRVARAPQSFWLDDILSAHEKMLTKGITNCIDSCTMMQECGFNLHLVDGPGENIKITTPEDFYTMRAILEAKENAQIYGFDE